MRQGSDAIAPSPHQSPRWVVFYPLLPELPFAGPYSSTPRDSSPRLHAPTFPICSISMKSSDLSSDDAFFGWCAVALLVSFFLPVSPFGHLQLSECFVPVMAWQCWRRRRELVQVFMREALPLLLAYLWMGLAVVLHFCRGCGSVYDLAVFLYMGLIFSFFRVTRLPDHKKLAAAGLSILAVVLAGYLLAKLGILTGRLTYVDVHFGTISTELMLYTRYQYLFTNPNLLGGAYVIPALMCLPFLKERFEKGGARALLVATPLALLLILPLLATASKMAVMTFAVLAGLWGASPLLARIGGRWMATALAVAFGMVCLMTVWFKTYPACQTPPWIDFAHRGNYSVHQEIYGRILLDGGMQSALFGHSPRELRVLYPRYADREKIQAILEPYGFQDELDNFCNFMDPHNEYLNTASFFGVPALLGILAFLVMLMARALHRGLLPEALFVAGLLFCFFWEDAASKRFIWAAVGMAAASVASCGATTTGHRHIAAGTEEGTGQVA